MSNLEENYMGFVEAGRIFSFAFVQGRRCVYRGHTDEYEIHRRVQYPLLPWMGSGQYGDLLIRRFGRHGLECKDDRNGAYRWARDDGYGDYERVLKDIVKMTNGELVTVHGVG